ncbi:MAG: ADP-ribosyl-[dinitrogen reductase] hydrolase [Formivibrio sp.]|nr:ADP-ribosyl-[dinitrogen reductase] hydrolase [Formivibrio sp.]
MPKPAQPAQPTTSARANAAMLGVALGDALGATLEFMTPSEIRHQFGLHHEIIGGGWLHLKPGQITDDTGMMLALSDAILQNNGQVIPLACAKAFDGWMRNRPVDIGNTVRRGIVHFRLSGQTAVQPSVEAAGNGALMRCLPVILATFGADETETMAAWQAQAHVTHNNALSDLSGALFMQLIHAALAGASKRQLLNEVAHPFAKAHPEFTFRPKRRDYPSGYVIDTVQAVLQAFFDTDSFDECLVEVVNRGGDSDTTGAIAGMLAGAHYGLGAIPARWLKQLDPHIRERCTSEGEKLLPRSQLQ